MTHPTPRRDFLRQSAALAAGALAAGPVSARASRDDEPPKRPLIWGNLLHLGYNMWCDWDNPENAGRHTNCS